MMMMSLCEHAKQPLSLPLPPKVFFHLSFTSLILCSWLLFHQCVTSTLPFSITISFNIFIFLNASFSSISLFLYLSLFDSNAPSPDPPWHWFCDCVLVMWSYNWSWSMWWCAVQGVVNPSVGVHPFGSYSLFFDSVAFSILFLQLVVNQIRKVVSKLTVLTHTKKVSFSGRLNLFCFFKLELSVFLFSIELCI